jgi:hypothetical protein
MPENKPENQADIHEYGEVLITWKFPEYEELKRGKAWYIIGGIVIILLFIYSYFTNNPLFALIVLIGAILTVILARRKPELVDIFITNTGVLIGNTFTHYRDFKDFAIVYQPPEVKKLYLETRGALKPRFTIPLEDINPLAVREILLDYLDEDLEREEEASSEVLTRLFKL